jgi:hypothetical protein
MYGLKPVPFSEMSFSAACESRADFAVPTARPERFQDGSTPKLNGPIDTAPEQQKGLPFCSSGAVLISCGPAKPANDQGEAALRRAGNAA